MVTERGAGVAPWGDPRTVGGDDIGRTVDNVEILEDISLTGKERPWKEKKQNNTILSEVYKSINLQKSFRLKDCASTLEFSVYADGTKKLKNAYFCHVRLCPVCGWRRGLKIFSQTQAILEELVKAVDRKKHPLYRYLFLTLTVKNCSGSELSSTLDDIFKSWHLFSKLKIFKNAVAGWMRSLEVVHDTDEYITLPRYMERMRYYDSRGIKPGDKNPNYNKYHPHLHCILVVPADYFDIKSTKYISQEKFSQSWQGCLKAEYMPIVDVRVIRTNNRKGIAKAIAEVAKYTVKDSDYIVPEDWDLSIDTVATLDDALHRRRLVAYGGIMKEIHKKLNLDDAIDGDLIKTDVQDDDMQEVQNTQVYCWSVGYQQYIRKE